MTSTNVNNSGVVPKVGKVPSTPISCAHLFEGNKTVTKLPAFHIPTTISIAAMFKNASKLEVIDISDCSKVTGCEECCKGCIALQDPIETLPYANITHMRMLYQDSGITHMPEYFSLSACREMQLHVFRGVRIS